VLKKLLIPFLIMVFTLTVCIAVDDAPEVSCNSAVVYNVEYDRIIYQKNIDEPVFPASFTKIMTAVLALEYENKPSGIEVTSSALEGLTGNYAGLKIGEYVPYDDLLKALIVAGANDAALVLAQHIGTTVDGFVDMMNAKAKELGMTATHFTNPTGMHDGFMETTVSDMLKLCRYAYHINEYMEISSMPKYDMPKTNKSPLRSLITRNLMLSKIFGGDYYDGEIRGMNSGSTEQAGFCLATTKENDGLVYLCIVSGSKKDEDKRILSYIDTDNLYEYVFANYRLTDVFTASSSVSQVPVRFSGTVDNAVIVSAQTLKSILPADADLKADVHIDALLKIDTLDAPVKSGSVVGYADIFFGEEKLGTVALVTQSNIERSNFLYLLFLIGEFFKRKEVMLVVLGILAAFIIYLIIAILAMPTKRK